jgi:hypothetical protein
MLAESELVLIAYETPALAPTRPVKVARVGALVNVWVFAQVFEDVVAKAEEMVIAPVLPVVWRGYVAASKVTPVLVTFPFAYARPFE